MPNPQPQRPSVFERARNYIAVMPASISGSGGHDALFNVVRALLHGFGFVPHEARPLVEEFNRRCDPPWSEGEIGHKLRSVDGLTSKWPRGYLRGETDWKPTRAERRDFGIPTEAEVKKKIEFDGEKLRQIAGSWREVADLAWLANRSSVDPARVDTGLFLKLLYPGKDKILCFQNEYSQGDALWPAETPPTGGKCGVWFLPQPVSGEYTPNPDGPRLVDGKAPMSRRHARSVMEFRYFVLESDEAPLRDWLGFIVQAPLPIEALYTSGGRSVHALVRVNCATAEAWQQQKRDLMPFLMGSLMFGADRGTWSCVRLTRLPGCLRLGKMVTSTKPGPGGRELKSYQRFDTPELQKLLYFRPGASRRPICQIPPERDVVATWTGLAALGISDADETDGAVLKAALRYYANVSEPCRAALAKLCIEDDDGRGMRA